MKPAVLALTVALMTAGVSIAADTQVPQRQLKQRGSYSLNSNAYFMGRYSKNLNDMIDGALRMNLTAEQKSQVSALSGKYSKPMSSDETDVRKLRMNIPKMLNDPSFDPAAVKQEIEKASALDKKISDDYVDALASLRQTIGKENYQTLTKSVFKFRNNLVQMRTNKQSFNRQQGTTRSGPAKTNAPSAAESKN